MKPLDASVVDMMKTTNSIRITAFALLSLSLSLFFFSNPFPFSFFYPTALSTSSISWSPEASPLPPPSPPPSSVPPPSPPHAFERTGIVNENGAMSEDFEIGEFDSSLIEDLKNLSGREGEKEKENVGVRVTIERYKVCEQSMSEYIPCLDNVEKIMRLNLSASMEKYERHCPDDGKGLNCLVPIPNGYQTPIPWPQSRDEL